MKNKKLASHLNGVRWSVGTKLLLGLTSFLVIMSLAFAASALFIFVKDKRNAIYSDQLAQVYRIGKDFELIARHQLNTLRLALVEFDPTSPETWAANRGALQQLLNNQNDILLVRIEKLDTLRGTLEPILETSRTELLSKLNYSAEKIKIEPALVKILMKGTLKDPYAFMNVSEPGSPPLLAAFLEDQKTPISPGIFLVAIGFVSIAPLKNSEQTQLTITDQEGWVLFSSDPAFQFTHFNLSQLGQFKNAVSSHLESGTLEFKNAAGHFLGSYYRPGFDFVVLKKTDWSFAMKPIFLLAEQFVLIGILGLCFAIMIALFFAKSVTAPLSRLFLATQKIASGDFNVQLPATQADEIGVVTESFNSMSSQLGELLEQKIKHVKLEAEVALTSTVQQTLIPPSVIEEDRFKIFSLYQSADQCGGDWWGYFKVNHLVCFAVADATGHGLPSALITATIKSCCSVIEKVMQEQTGNAYSPADILSYAHHAIFESAKGKLMMTCFLGIWNTETMEFSYASAGHGPAYLFQAGETSFTRKALAAGGTRLGDDSTAPVFSNHQVSLNAGDILFLFTDGLSDGRNVSSEEMGKKKIRSRLDELVSAGALSVQEGLTQDLEIHRGGQSLDDDVTFAVIEIGKGVSK